MMTEKRFHYDSALEKIYDYDTCEDGIAESLDCFDACELLNELSEENEGLKKQLECSREESDDYCEELMGKDEFVRLYKRQRDDALKENRQLKSDNNRLVNETARIVAEHQRKVFDLIDKKIEHYQKQPILAVRISTNCEHWKSCLHNQEVNVCNKAKENAYRELKKELQK